VIRWLSLGRITRAIPEQTKQLLRNFNPLLRRQK